MTFTPPQPKIRGEVAMVDVNISQMTALSRFIAGLTGSPRHFPGSAFGFNGNNGLEKYFSQSFLTMDQAKHDAVIAAFRAVHQPIAAITTGLLVYDVTPKSSLHLGDFLEAVNGRKLHTVCELATVLGGTNEMVATVRRGHLSKATGALRFSPPTSVTLKPVRHEELLATYQASPCASAPTTRFGITSVNSAHLAQTIPAVSIDTTAIGGPSAGFAMALCIVNQLLNGRLVGGRSVAASGTIDQHGVIGDVGGVPEKAVAVGRANFTWFFVPKSEVEAARSAVPSRVHVVGVRSLTEAIAALKLA
jgi:PDZ domain-containing protein